MQLLIAFGHTAAPHDASFDAGASLQAEQDVGGISVAQRALRSAQLAGVTDVVAFVASARLIASLERDAIIATMRCRFVHLPELHLDRLDSTMWAETPGLNEEFLVLPGDRVITPALVRELIASKRALTLRSPRGEALGARLTAGHLEAIEAEGDLEALFDRLHIDSSVNNSPELLRVRSAQDARLAKRALMKTLRKPLTRNGDGLTAFLINRPISLSLTRVLLHTPATPNAVTFFNLLVGVYAGYLLSQGEVLTIALGALLMQVVSILDGVDGELARMKLLQSPIGAWFDSVSDDVIRVATIMGLGLGCYALSPDPSYLWASALGTLAILSTVFTLYRDLQGEANVSLNSAKWFFEEEGRRPGAWQNLLTLIGYILKRDTYTLALMALAAVGLPQLSFVSMLVGIAIITVTHFLQKASRALNPAEQESGALADEMSRA